MTVHQKIFIYTPTRNFISQLYICKTPKKNYLTENPTERYWNEKKSCPPICAKAIIFLFFWCAHLFLIISKVRRTTFSRHIFARLPTD
jgi:hypothetical protein